MADSRNDVRRRADDAYEKAHRLRTAFNLLGLKEPEASMNVIMEALSESQAYLSFSDFEGYASAIEQIRATRGGE